MKNKTLLTAIKIVLHVVGWPLLFALVFILNRNVIKGGSMYGVAVFVSAIITVLMAGVYYLAYFLVRTKKNRSIRNQHIIIAIVAVCVLSGFWMLLDAVIPGPLETATSSTLRWEDLSDNWGARAEVQEGLLRDYVTINYTLGRLTAPNGETIEEYISQGPNGNEELNALLQSDFHSIDSDGYASFRGPSIDYAQSDRMTIPVLLHLFLDDRSGAQGANSEYAKQNELESLTIAVPYYNMYAVDDAEFVEENVRIYHGYVNNLPNFLVTDDDLNVLDAYTSQEVAVVSVANGKWTVVYKNLDELDEEGNYTELVKQFDTKAAAIEYAKAETVTLDDGTEINKNTNYYFVGGYRQAAVNWHVLDMMGTAMEMSILSENLMQTNIGEMLSGISAEGMVGSALSGFQTALAKKEVKIVADVFQLDLVPDALVLVADMVAEDEVLGSPLYISIDTATGNLALQPSNSHRGTLGYMEMAWLENQGLLYIIVSLFSVRTLFYIYGPIMAIIAVLLGIVREQESKLPAKDAKDKEKAPKKEKAKKEKKAAAVTADAAPAKTEDAFALVDDAAE